MLYIVNTSLKRKKNGSECKKKKKSLADDSHASPLSKCLKQIFHCVLSDVWKGTQSKQWFGVLRVKKQPKNKQSWGCRIYTEDLKFQRTLETKWMQGQPEVQTLNQLTLKNENHYFCWKLH